MKKIILAFTLLAGSFILWAQAPGEFQYQAVIRDAEGSPLVDNNLTVQFSLLEGSENGTSVYSETHTVTTNSFGLINITIGSGTSNDVFENINWSTGSFFIKTEVDLGSGFQDFGTKQLVSVPFALYGEDADADVTNEIQNLTLTGSLLEISDGNSVDLGVLGADTDDQTLSIDGTNLSISEGNTIDVSSLQDGIGTDDQTLILTGSELSIEGGNSVDLGSLGTDTDDQTLSLLGTELTISEGNSVNLSGIDTDTNTQLTEEEVDDFVANNGYLTQEVDGSITNEIQDISLEGTSLSISDGSTIDLAGIDTDTNTQLSEAEVDEFVTNNGYLTTESDDQTLSLDGNILTLEEGGTVDLSAFLDDTDTNTQLTETEVDAFVDNNGYLTEQSDDQAISLDGNILTLEDGGTVDLSAFLDDTDTNTQLSEAEVDDFVANNGYLTEQSDDQALTLSSNTLSLEDGGDVDLSAYLDNTDVQNLSDVLSNGADANTNSITNLADPTNDQDAATKSYVDSNDLGAFSETSNVISAGDTDDDFVFGSTQLADDNSTFDDNSRMFFDKSKGAFRAGEVSGDQWDNDNVGNYSIGLGIDNQASQYGAVAIGDGNDATAAGAIAIGTGVAATVDYAVAIGQYNTASGLNATALGYSTTASGSNSTTLGNNAIARSDSELAIGAFNTDYTPVGDDTDRAFVIGNGLDSDNRSDAFTVYKNGNALLEGNLSLAEPTDDAHAATKKYVDDNSSDAQDLTLTTNTLSLTNDASTVDLSGYLDNTDAQSLSNVLENGADANATVITNLADPTNDQDAATKAYVDTEISGVAFDYNTSGDAIIEVLDNGEGKDVDFSYSTGSGASSTGSSYSTIGQSFTATKTGVLTKIDFKLNTSPVDQSDVFFVLYSGNGSGGTELDRVSFTPVSGLKDVSYVLGSEVTVTAGQQYTLIIENPARNVAIIIRFDNPYSGGNAFYGSNATNDIVSLTSYVIFRNTPKTAISANNKSVGIGTANPDASAALEVNSTTGGLLMPRMTTTERDAISSPADGLMIYNTTTNKFQGRANGAWVDLHM